MISGTNGVAGAFQVLNSARTLEEAESAKQVTALARAKDWGALGPAILFVRIDGKGEDKNPEVPHEEAVRRLRETGETEMADDLDAYTNRTSQKGGWDDAVTGEQGDLYKRHGKRMREIIWPYRYR
ncbi:hypothetical protein KM868_09855 [Micrococcus luteus]|nr:hypothetical protein [Micrococcus luteus]